MLTRLRNIFPSFISSILSSYSQIFFSNNKIFALILILVSFLDIWAGISGLLSVVIANGVAYIMGFNRINIRSGYYGFNTLLVGLGVGVFYQPSPEFFLILAFSALLTLFLTIFFEGIIGKYGLPYLSFSFLIAIWVVSLASRQFEALQISERGIYNLNEMYLIGGMPMVRFYDFTSNLPLHESLLIYFKSLGAIFFQYRVVAGVLIAIGLLVASRISFTLSLLGFFSAYYYYKFIGADITELSYSYIGFNFILSGIAIGGFFIVPSRYSYLWVILLTPLISFLLTSTSAFFDLVQLSVYSLPFNIVVVVFLYILKFRERFFQKPEIVLFQQFSPEKNLYSTLNNKERFNNYLYFPISLPFFGKWKVDQGHEGEHTHKDEWKHAWDFVIEDDEHSHYSGSGNDASDFYCFDRPVIAPADGEVVEVVDNVEDNEIGDMNLNQNWGNTIVLQHGIGLYTNLSHLKKGSILVKKGDRVQMSDVLAYCGNSGRSPEPHLHFQVQETPYIGSKTLEYPLGHYIENLNGKYKFHSFDKPVEGGSYTNIQKNDLLYNAFRFVPGQELVFDVVANSRKRRISWEIQSDIYNYTYIYCKKTKAKAFFRFENNMFYFNHFEGSKRAMLYYFYLGHFKVLCGYYSMLSLEDSFPVNLFNPKPAVVVQDFVAPFFRFLNSKFELTYVKMEDYFDDGDIEIHSKVVSRIGRRNLRRLKFQTSVSSRGIKTVKITDGSKEIEMIAVDEKMNA